MNRMLKTKIAACVLVLTVISMGYIFADDVTVQLGDLTADGCISGSDLLIQDEYNTYLYFDSCYMRLASGYGLRVSDYVYPNYSVLNVDPYTYEINIGNEYNPTDLNLQGTLFADYIGDYSYQPYACLSDTEINGYLLIEDEIELYWDNEWGEAHLETIQLNIADAFWVQSSYYEMGPLALVDGDFYVTGIIYGEVESYSYSSYMYEQKSRSEIIEHVKKEVPPDKQSAVAMFFNKETKKIENYVASEGKFYDMQGNVVHELAEVVEPTTKYETAYHFDSVTGQVKSILRPVQEKYQIKEGYSMDKKTGKFINKDNSQVVSREEALEIYVASEGKIYDLNHNFLRDADKKNTTEITTAGNNNGSKSQIKTAQNNAENEEITVKPATSN